VHVKRRSREVHKPQSVTLRREELAVARVVPDDPDPTRTSGSQQ
jgi:hypothetical protein